MTRDRDRHWRRQQETARWVAQAFPAASALSAPRDPVEERIEDLLKRGLDETAWKVCLEAGLDPERFGLASDYDEEEWRAIAHYVDASHARYRYPWQAGDLAFPPSSLIVFGYIARACDYPGWPDFGQLSSRFDKPYAGSRCRDEDTCRLNAHHWRRLVIEHARDRYRKGFYADPFASEPLRRPA